MGTDKGLLIPRVSLQSLTDNVTIPNPATALLVYNTNAELGKAGFYYNSGTAAASAWSPVGGDASLTLPFSQLGTNNGPLFLINNNDGNGTSVGISGLAANAIGVRGATLSGKGVVGHAASTGTGVFASVADTDGKALEVSGPMRIAGAGQSPGNGKVLMSDGSGNATWENIAGGVAFRASGVLSGGNEVVPGNGMPIKVAFAGENYDKGDDYINATGTPHSTFIAPTNGVYHFDAQIRTYYNAVDGYQRRLLLILTRSNNRTVVSEFSDSGTNICSSSLSIDIALIMGDQIHIEVSTFGTQSATIGINPEESHFSGRLLFK
ncbi:C1q-like domain-containing protein [Dyadobacter sp. CY351]|uniref:C1q-like domain-containing protein n=1 Tax=Dyadobacter sp. CY351 TaxID=2909337 RepID=UPI001F29E0CF|nr:hypothetical protein [Dyadobacter sp. CY351]MCF2516385.1 hypothetical protein [Dyadobacter sp. CY351]